MGEREAVEASGELSERTAIVSINSPGSAPVAFAEGPWLLGVFRMQFYDVEMDYAGMRAAVQEDFSGLRAFVDRMADAGAVCFLVHCGAGISRSSATAQAISDYLGADLDVFSDPRYMPNPHVLELARRELGVTERWETQPRTVLQRLFGHGPRVINQSYREDPRGTVEKVARGIARGWDSEKNARRAGISLELCLRIERICREHPGATTAQILQKVGMG